LRHDRSRGRSKEIVHVVDDGDEGPISGRGDSRCDGIGLDMSNPVESRRIAWDMVERVVGGMDPSFGCSRR
jgi:hypothetical protein